METNRYIPADTVSLHHSSGVHFVREIIMTFGDRVKSNFSFVLFLSNILFNSIQLSADISAC